MKILITGAAGFIGSNIVHKFMYDKELSANKILLYDNYSFGSNKNISESICMKVGFEYLDSKNLEDIDVLIHCATSNIIYAMDKPVETFQNNATNTIKLFQKFKGKIIYTSTASVYGQADIIPTHEDANINTTNAYDQSKYIAELFLKKRGNYTTLRLSNVYGPYQQPDNPYCGVIGKLLHSYLKSIPFNINDTGLQTRDFTYIDDVVKAIVLAVFQESKNTEINIATGIETSINNLVSNFSLLKVIHINSRKIDTINRRCLNINKAKYLLGWQPEINLSEGINKTIEWIKNSKI